MNYPLVDLQIFNDRIRVTGAMTLWKPRRCCRCRRTIYRLDGSVAETRQDGERMGVWHYHYGCWYALLKEQGAQWLKPTDPATDTQPPARLGPQAVAAAVREES
jgi:hypothetical protein